MSALCVAQMSYVLRDITCNKLRRMRILGTPGCWCFSRCGNRLALLFPIRTCACIDQLVPKSANLLAFFALLMCICRLASHIYFIHVFPHFLPPSIIICEICSSRVLLTGCCSSSFRHRRRLMLMLQPTSVTQLTAAKETKMCLFVDAFLENTCSS